MCIACVEWAIRKGALHLLANWKPSGPNLLDEPLKDFIVNPVDLPWKWVKSVAEPLNLYKIKYDYPRLTR